MPGTDVLFGRGKDMTVMRKGILIAAFAVMALVAIAGWVRKPANSGNSAYGVPGVSAYAPAVPAYSASAPAYGQPASYDASGRPVYPAATNQGAVPCVDNAAYRPAESDRYYSTRRPVRVVS